MAIQRPAVPRQGRLPRPGRRRTRPRHCSSAWGNRPPS